MLAYYLHRSRPAALDRARAVIAAMPPETTVVSPAPVPWGWPGPWAQVGGDEPASWADWTTTHQPDLVIVDGPVEHVLAVRELDVPTAVLAEPGTDGAAYATADLVLAPWAPGPPRPATQAPAPTIHLGALGWAASSAAARLTTGSLPTPQRPSCVVLSASGGGPGPRERRDVVLGASRWAWWFAPERDLLQPFEPLWDRLAGADVVVCAATSSNLAAAAATRTPAVLVVPAGAPASQRFLADVAARTGAAIVTAEPSGPASWRELLAQAHRLRRDAWDRWDPRPGLEELRSFAGVGLATA
ncbi:hypothetical protein ABIE44_001501 [Marmoricola sp. OAE513]|uniref:hypothetical protein n=1 Tax=Marmoricola sp. OAE513 TaxID=2817894 RepID=UPI001AE8296A